MVRPGKRRRSPPPARSGPTRGETARSPARPRRPGYPSAASTGEYAPTGRLPRGRSRMRRYARIWFIGRARLDTIGWSRSTDGRAFKTMGMCCRRDRRESPRAAGCARASAPIFWPAGSVQAFACPRAVVWPRSRGRHGGRSSPRSSCSPRDICSRGADPALSSPEDRRPGQRGLLAQPRLARASRRV